MGAAVLEHKNKAQKVSVAIFVSCQIAKTNDQNHPKSKANT